MSPPRCGCAGCARPTATWSRSTASTSRSPQGEFFTLLGPSGSGKTTTLRLIAGFERPDAGTVELAGRDVSDVPPYERDVNTVFQDYALFPHMTVAENVAYGLRVKGVPRREREAARSRTCCAGAPARTSASASRSSSPAASASASRSPARSSTGREVLLLDEPLGALDLKLRQEMQIELKSIQQDLGITFVYVTHDQDEALTMSDRMAVFNDGRIEQVGAPAEVYERPRERVRRRLRRHLERARARRPALTRSGPEKIRMLDAGAAPASGMHAEPGRIRDVVYVGMVTRYIVELDRGGELAGRPAEPRDLVGRGARREGRAVRLAWRPEHQLEIDNAGETEGEQ